ncbi:response regulator transcription factor, partial [bacterium]
MPISILIVEDNPEMGQLIELMLEMEGYSTTLVTNGTDALEVARSQTPELIIMDIGLPDGHSGFEVAQELQSAPATAEIPIFFVTARAEIDDVVAGLKLGVDYLTKPFAVPELVARVN